MSDLDHRVLFIAPTLKDGQITAALLHQAGLNCEIFRSIETVAQEIQRGAGALLLTDEAVAFNGTDALLRCLKEQPEWSDLPVVMLAKGGDKSPKANAVMKELTNLTLLERPAAMRSVVSTVEAAIRARKRQYQIRDQMAAIRSTEAKSTELQEQLQIAIDASELGTFHCEMPLGKIFWNERCKTHFWLPADAEIDIDLFYSILHPEDCDRTRKAVEACVNDGQPYDVEYRTVSPTGKIRWIRATGKTYYDGNDKPVRFDGTTQDITERRQMEEFKSRVLASERKARADAEHASRMKDEFLATLSHELRTPLNVIFGWTQLLKRGKDDPKTVVRAVEIIDRNVAAQSQLIEDLLDMNRIIAGKVRLDVTDVNLREIIQSALDSTKPGADAKGIDLQVELGNDVGMIRGDGGRLQQVLWNLLTNAVKFTPKGGRILVGAQMVADEAEIFVTDSGNGISPEFLPHLFERFSQADGSITRKHTGLGLGLSIVKTLVEMHGGRISATSSGLGHGATFTLNLPVQVDWKFHSDNKPGDASSKASTASASDSESLKGVRVLVVDDEQDAREIMIYILREWNADALAAA